jgi:hypothetical protein
MAHRAAVRRDPDPHAANHGPQAAPAVVVRRRIPSPTMKFVLFCGGRGLRLRERSEVIPMPMVGIGYRPILWHVMRYYEELDVLQALEAQDAAPWAVWRWSVDQPIVPDAPQT